MRYYSTKQPDITVSMREAVMACVPQTGGLYLPASLPTIPEAFVRNMTDMALQEIAYATTNVFLGEDLDSSEIKSVIDGSLSFDTPLVEIGNGLFALELFHGPTKVFKDFGARFLAGLFKSLRHEGCSRLNVLVATTGNTGMAVARAFSDCADVNVFILFPHGAMTRYDASLLASAGSNIHAVEVGGTIEDCKSMVAAAFADVKLRDKLMLSSANSTNFARLMPQVALYFYAMGRLCALGIDTDTVDLAVPSGNLGMLVSGLMARRIGLKCGRLIAACNANNSFDRYLKTGLFEPKATVSTYAHLMDLSSPSNLPRLIALCDNDLAILRQYIDSVTVGDDLIADTIRSMNSSSGYVSDPHTAVGIAALGLRKDTSRPGLVFATAHPSRSADIVSSILGKDMSMWSDRNDHAVSATHPDRLPPTYPALRKYILSYQYNVI